MCAVIPFPAKNDVNVVNDYLWIEQDQILKMGEILCLKYDFTTILCSCSLT